VDADPAGLGVDLEVVADERAVQDRVGLGFVGDPGDPDGLGPAGCGKRIFVTATHVGGFDFIPAQPDRSVDAEPGLAWDRTGGPHAGRVYLVQHY